MALFWRKRPQSVSLVESGIKDRHWFLQFSILALVIIIACSIWYYFYYYSPAQLAVTSEPAGAEILIDRKATGHITPAVIKGLRAGSYLIQVRHSTLVAVPAGLAVRLEPREKAAIAFQLVTPSQVAVPVYPTAKQVTDSIKAATTLESGRDYPVEHTYPQSVQIRNRIPAVGGSGRVYVSSTVPDADIYLDGIKSAQLTDAILLVPVGTHRVQVKKEGYISDPPESSVLISAAFQESRLIFRLTPSMTNTMKKVSIKTKPIDGTIRVDGMASTLGTWEGELKYGMHLVEFGNVTGYVAPSPLRLNVTQTDPSGVVYVNYIAGYAVELLIDESGRPQSRNVLRWTTGLHHPEVGGFQENPTVPPIVFVKQWNKYAWEFGLAFASKNPVGGQYLQLEFEMPKVSNYDPQMFLWLQTVRGNRNYPLTFMNRTIGVVEVNGKIVNAEWVPTRTIDTSDPEGWERHAIADKLVSGRNVIRIYSHDLNLRYFYISGIRIGPQPTTQGE